MNRGEVRWYTFRQPDKKRPVLLLTRDSVLTRLNEVIVVPVTRRDRLDRGPRGWLRIAGPVR